MSYSTKMSSLKPGLILILVDQSGSMTEQYTPQQNKAEFTSAAVNRVINTIVTANMDGEKVKQRCFIAIIGYGEKVKSIQTGSLQDFADNPKRTESVMRRELDGAGGILELPFEMPIWLEAEAGNGTPMHRAFGEAYKVVEDWVKGKQDHAAPIIINITDGMPDSIPETEKEAEKVKSLGTADGKVLIFNAHISDSSQNKIFFPGSSSELNDEYAQFLFRISSEVPESMHASASSQGFDVKQGSRGMVFNADAEALVRLLNFGSTGVMPAPAE